MEYEGDYLFYNKYNGKGYDENGNIIYELKNGTGKVKEYNDDNLIFEGEYLNGKKWKGKVYDLLNNEVFELKNGTGRSIEYDYENGIVKDMIIWIIFISY